MSKIDPIYVYNRHFSPVSALCFGKFDKKDVIITGSNDGILHVWDLINFSTLYYIKIHESKIINLECIDNLNNENWQYDAKLAIMSRNETLNENLSLKFISQEKNGKVKFIILFKNENEELKFDVYNEIECSDCTFCSFQMLTHLNNLFLVIISTKNNNCINFLIIKENCIQIEKTILIEKNLGLISSMKLNMNEFGLILFVGTEIGIVLIYTCQFDTNNEKLNLQTINDFELKYSKKLFDNSFISSIELLKFDSNLIKFICGSVEDYLVICTMNNLLNNLKTFKTNEQNSEELSFSIKYLKITNKGINSIVKRIDNKIFASSGWDGRIRIFSLKTSKPLAILNFHKQAIEMIKFSTKNKKGFLLAAAGQDKLVTIWSIYN